MSSPNKDLHLISSLSTAGMAGLMIAVLVGVGGIDTSDTERKSKFDGAMRIEAALAYKKPNKKKRQPQKRKKKKFKKPDGPKISRDDKADPVDRKKDVRVDPDEIDPMAVFKKNKDLQQDDNLSDTGSEEDLDEGAIFGDEWGSGDKNKGDPYVGGLKARIERTFRGKAPGFIEKGKTVWGCVKLEKDGKVAESEVPKEGRSDIPALNSAMEETLKNIPAMDKPVPPHLVKLLTEMGVCFRLKTK